MFRKIFILALFCLLFLPSFGFAQGFKDQAALETRLAYLYDLEGVTDVFFDNNNVYIGFDQAPVDIGQIIRGAALNGNRAYGARVHVWACRYNSSEGDPARWPRFCFATGQSGRVVKTDCR